VLSEKDFMRHEVAKRAAHMQKNVKIPKWAACCHLMITIVNGLSRERNAYHFEDLERGGKTVTTAEKRGNQ